MSARRADDEPDELELHVYQRLLGNPERWWTEAAFYYREPARVRDILATLLETGWLRTDETGRFQLTESGVGPLTWVARTGGRRRGVLRTFLYEGGTAARQMYRSRHGKRHSFIEDGQDDPSGMSRTEFEQTRVHGFWWTLPRYGLTAAWLARQDRQRYRRQLPAPEPE